jgi:NADPH:quinone reductase-like Zn-dependent oxidoreductase
MKAVVVEKLTDDLSGIALRQVPEPVPGSGQVLVRIAAASLNPVDWQLARCEIPGWPVPHILGLDAAGTIAVVGPGVSGRIAKEVSGAVLDEDSIMRAAAREPRRSLESMSIAPSWSMRSRASARPWSAAC